MDIEIKSRPFSREQLAKIRRDLQTEGSAALGQLSVIINSGFPIMPWWPGEKRAGPGACQEA